MIDFSDLIEISLNQVEQLRLLAAVEHLIALSQDEGLGTEHGPTLSDVRDALSECERLSKRI